jgi:hypothetical protein
MSCDISPPAALLTCVFLLHKCTAPPSLTNKILVHTIHHTHITTPHNLTHISPSLMIFVSAYTSTPPLILCFLLLIFFMCICLKKKQVSFANSALIRAPYIITPTSLWCQYISRGVTKKMRKAYAKLPYWDPPGEDIVVFDRLNMRPKRNLAQVSERECVCECVCFVLYIRLS